VACYALSKCVPDHKMTMLRMIARLNWTFLKVLEAPLTLSSSCWRQYLNEWDLLLLRSNVSVDFYHIMLINLCHYMTYQSLKSPAVNSLA
jgi:hypothetical protein